jgi:hypothetical protein
MKIASMEASMDRPGGAPAGDRTARASVCAPSGPPGRGEMTTVLVVWVVLTLASLFFFSIGNVPPTDASWDVLHSGRRFADVGFIASKFQPRWTPRQDPAPYLTYTHYPPFPYWISGVLHSLVSGSQERIRGMLHLIRIVGIATTLLAYLMLRQVGVRASAAALAVSLAIWSQWWGWATGDFSWIGWLPFALFGGTTAFLWALRTPRRATRNLAIALGTSCALVASLSAFDAWLWFPTFAAVLCIGARGPRRGLRKSLLVICALTVLATGVSGAVRMGINAWHFGSLEGAVRDLREAYQVRGSGDTRNLESAENQVNYKTYPKQSVSRWEWLRLYYGSFAQRLALMYLPPKGASWWVVGGVLLLASPAWAAGVLAGGRGAGGVRPWPSPLLTLCATQLAATPFVVACPAISVQQPWEILAHGPAVLLLAGSILEPALASLTWLSGRLMGAVGGHVLTAAAAAVAIGSPVLRLHTAELMDWPIPLSVFRAAADAAAQTDGVVFVNVLNTNPLMYLIPHTSQAAAKPVMELQRCPACFQIAGRAHFLFLDQPEQAFAQVPQDWVSLPTAGLPAGWRLFRFERDLGGAY